VIGAENCTEQLMYICQFPGRFSSVIKIMYGINFLC